MPGILLGGVNVADTLIETGWFLTKWVTIPIAAIYIIIKLLQRAAK